jgi:hypothetical protein
MNWCSFCKFYNSTEKKCLKYLTLADQARQIQCVNASGFDRINRIGKRYYTLKYINPYIKKLI